MSHMYKPDNYTSVAPYLVVDGAARTVDFLVKVFAAERLRTYPGEGGKLAHAEVRVDDTVVMLSDSMEGWPAVPSHVHVYVKDVDATYRRALEAGAASVQEPVRKGDEDKRGGFRDPGGTTWWIGTKVE
jgi:PhnB protein